MAAMHPISPARRLEVGAGNFGREEHIDSDFILENGVIPPTTAEAARTSSTPLDDLDIQDDTEKQGRVYEKLDSLLERMNNLQEEECSIELEVQALLRRKEQVRRLFMNYVRRFVNSASIVKEKQNERRQEPAPARETDVQECPVDNLVYEEIFLSDPQSVVEITTSVEAAVTEAEKLPEVPARGLIKDELVTDDEEANTETGSELLDPLEVDATGIQRPENPESQLTEPLRSVKVEVDEFEDSLRTAGGARSKSPDEPANESSDESWTEDAAEVVETPRKKRFRLSSSLDIDDKMNNSVSKNTQDQEQVIQGLFVKFLEQSILDTNFFQFSAEKLDSCLSKFFLSLRKPDGSFYHANTIRTYRASLVRIMKRNKVGPCPNADLNNEIRFPKMNSIFTDLLKTLQGEGKARTQHAKVVTGEHLQQMYTSPLFDINTPIGLFNKCFLDIMLFTGYRGRKHLVLLTVSQFKESCDENGRKYFYIETDEDANDTPTKGRLYEMTGPLCPYSSLKKFLEKRKGVTIDRLFLKPKPIFTDDCWYYSGPIGKNALAYVIAIIFPKIYISWGFVSNSSS